MSWAPMRILVIGDVVGKPGRQAAKLVLSDLVQQYDLDLIIANGENIAGGVGLTPETADELLQSGINVITSGNHVWEHKELIPYLDSGAPVLRPLNYPSGTPGHGHLSHGNAMVVNLIGRTFIANYDCPFRAIDKLLNETEHPPVVIVDFHAEATSEKMAMGYYLNGRVSAVLGTHTHVGTVDARILSGNTAYVTDIGMTGPRDSVIGMNSEQVIQRFLTQRPYRFSVAGGRAMFNSVLIEVDRETGRAKAIERIDREVG